MSCLIFDTETSGMPSRDLPASHPKQARILQLACLHLDDEFKEIAHFCHLIIPSTDFEIHPKALAAHGITKEMCINKGVTITCALETFKRYSLASKALIGFNIQFDLKMLDIEYQLINQNGYLKPDQENFCVMEAMTPICKLPSKWKGNKYKWPKLQEAYVHCFGKEFDKAHDALADVRATAEVYQWYLKHANRQPEVLA